MRPCKTCRNWVADAEDCAKREQISGRSEAWALRPDEPETFSCVFFEATPAPRAYTSPVKVRPNEMMKRVARKIGYTGRKFRLQPNDYHPTNLDSYWDEGSRDAYFFFTIGTGSLDRVHSNHPFFESGQKRSFPDLRQGTLLIRHTIFCGKDLGLTFFANDADRPAVDIIIKAPK